MSSCYKIIKNKATEWYGGINWNNPDEVKDIEERATDSIPEWAYKKLAESMKEEGFSEESIIAKQKEVIEDLGKAIGYLLALAWTLNDQISDRPDDDPTPKNHLKLVK